MNKCRGGQLWKEAGPQPIVACRLSVGKNRHGTMSMWPAHLHINGCGCGFGSGCGTLIHNNKYYLVLVRYDYSNLLSLLQNPRTIVYKVQLLFFVILHPLQDRAVVLCSICKRKQAWEDELQPQSISKRNIKY